ncbi:MAG: hypothetical protein ABGY71_07000 [bacterium]
MQPLPHLPCRRIAWALVILAALGGDLHAQTPVPNQTAATREPLLGPVRMMWMVHIDPSNWTLRQKFDHGCFVMDRMATLVESHGGRMTVACSRPFMDGCVNYDTTPSQAGALGDLAARGHEIGYHPHEGDLTSDSNLIHTLTSPYTTAGWPTHIEGNGSYSQLVSLGYKTGTGCGKDRATQLFGIPMHPYRPVEGDCYAEDPAGPLISIGRGAVDGAGQASDNLDEMLAALSYAIGRRRPDKLSTVNLTTTHPDSWFTSSTLEVIQDFQALDAWMTQELDPLLSAGLVAWTIPSELAGLYERWELGGGDNSDMFPPPQVTDPNWSWLDSSNAPLASDLVDEVLFDSQNRLWIGSGDEVGGLALFDAGTWTSITSSNSPLRADRITSLAEAPNGDIWIAAFASGTGTTTALHRYTGTGWSIFDSSNSPIPDPFLFEVAVDPAGVVWVGGKTGLFRYDGTGWSNYTSTNSQIPARQQAVWSIEAYSSTALYLGMRTGGVMHFEHQGDTLSGNDTWTLHDHTTAGAELPADTIHVIARHPRGKLFAGTLRGLAVLDGSTWTGYTSADSGLGYDQIVDIAFDSQGRAWLATFGGGLSRFDPQTETFENFDIPDGTVHGRFNNSVTLSPADAVFAASLRAGGISIYTGP